jgi:hypothetical protein
MLSSRSLRGTEAMKPPSRPPLSRVRIVCHSRQSNLKERFVLLHYDPRETLIKFSAFHNSSR